MGWDKVYQNLLETTSDPCTTGRLLATATKESGAWFKALSVPHLGTKLDTNSVHIAIGLHLGADIVEEHQCVCGALVTRQGMHGLSCKRSSGRISRHHLANETIRCALVSGGVPLVLEPMGVCREDAKRPDGMTSFCGRVGELSFGISHVLILLHPPIDLWLQEGLLKWLMLQKN